MAKPVKPLVRPMSPHWQYVNVRTIHTMGFSILHRFTGIALSLGLIPLAYWLIAAASGPARYAEAQEVLTSVWMQVAMVGWLFSFTYHLLNGIRHLVWDSGRGFGLDVSRRSGYVVFIIAVVVTIALIALFNARMGGAA